MPSLGVAGALAWALLSSGSSLARIGDREVPLASWTPPPFWTAPREVEVEGAAAPVAATTILPFVALPPCRIVDTRGGAPLGGGPLAAGAPRSYTLGGQCGIPLNAAALSLNVTVTNTLGPGFILAYPKGTAQPGVSTLNYVANQSIANAAVVPTGTGPDAGGVTFVAGVSGADLVVDTNGYYAATNVVNTVNGLTGDVTLAAGSNVSLTPSGNTLTVAATGAVASVAGTNGISASPSTGAVVVTSNATPNDTASTIVARDAAGDFTAHSVALDGNLALPFVGSASGRIEVLGQPIFHATPLQNMFVGFEAGNLTTTQTGHTGIGYYALKALTTGADDTAVGTNAADGLTTGSRNTIVGSQAFLAADTANDNTFVGWKAGEQGLNPSSSTAVGSTALRFDRGFANTALGYDALGDVTLGQRNIGIGLSAGAGLTTGTDNIFIGGAASPASSTFGSIYIGQVGVQSKTYIAGISGATVPGGTTVIVDASGHLGTTTSSRRYKENVADVGDRSDVLMELRPVTFTYRRDLDPQGIPQVGLIAEEVDEVAPWLVVRDAQGRPDGVRYQLLPPLMLNELQRLRRALEAGQRQVEDLQRDLARALARIEALEARGAAPAPGNATRP